MLGRGAAAMADARRDYVAFWRYFVSLGREIRRNGLTPVIPCICLPAQVLASVDDEVVHFLGLVSNPATIRRRIAERQAVSDVPAPETHVQIDQTSRCSTVSGPHTFELHDVATSDLHDTLTWSMAWASRHVHHAVTSFETLAGARFSTDESAPATHEG